MRYKAPQQAEALQNDLNCVRISAMMLRKVQDLGKIQYHIAGRFDKLSMIHQTKITTLYYG